MEFRKALAKYYHTWYNDCLVSAEYCGDNERGAKYLADAKKYKEIIDKFAEEIIFFSEADNAFLRDEALPERFRGYR